MEQLAFKSYTIYLSCAEPTSTDITGSQSIYIQGNTNLVFNLSGIATSTYGIYKLYGKVNDIQILALDPQITSTTSTLPITSFTYTVYPSNSSFTVNMCALYRNGLSAMFNVDIFSTPENILDMELNILNTQMLHGSGSFIPVMNIEGSDNTVYPLAYVNLSASDTPRYVVLLKTDPELTPSLSASTFGTLSTSLFINTENSERISAL